MNMLLDAWALLNTVVIVLGLGLAHDATHQYRIFSFPVLRAVIGYNLLIPALALAALKSSGWFSPQALMAMSLCVACAGGTSAGAFMSQIKGSAALAATLIVASLGASLCTIAVFSQLHWISIGSLSLPQLAAYLLAITLVPLWSGKALCRHFPAHSALWQPHVDRLGSLLVVLLIVALAVRYGKPILTGPREPLLAALCLVLIFVLPPFLERLPTQRRTIVVVTLIRNLTLVLSVLAVLPNAHALLPTVLAFGLLMYAMTGVLVWRWRTST